MKIHLTNMLTSINIQQLRQHPFKQSLKIPEFLYFVPTIQATVHEI